MSTPATPSWYDVLDVDPTAGADEIRARWKAQIADLDPTDRRFRLLNQGAEVLLDPERRAEHDALLSAEAEAEPEVGPEPDGAENEDTGGRGARAFTPEPRDPRTPAVGATTDSATEKRATGWVPPVWLIAGLAVLLVVLVVACGLVSRTPTDAALEADAREAQGAAEDAVVAILAYDYRDMDASRTAASAYLTPSFRADYDKLFAVLEESADAVKPVITVDVVASGVARVSSSGDRVSVLVFVNRPTTNASRTTPEVSQDQVTMNMALTDGEWLVDDMVTSPALPAGTEPSGGSTIAPSAETSTAPGATPSDVPGTDPSSSPSSTDAP